MRTLYRQQARSVQNSRRVWFISVSVWLAFFVMLGRLFTVQVIDYGKYKALADEQHLQKIDFTAQRGEIYARDHTNEKSGDTYPLAVNKTYYEVFLNPSQIIRPINTAEALSAVLGFDYQTALERAQKVNDVYEPIASKATEEQVNALKQTGLAGINFRETIWRYYPDKSIGSHILGFFGLDGERKVGKYGIEGHWEQELAGNPHEAVVPYDRTGGIIPETGAFINQSVAGDTLILTIDRTIQFEVCTLLQKTVERYAAAKGTVMVMETRTGRIRAMCNYPSFDPNAYNEVDDVQVFNNDAVFEAYEPGSVFKPIAMAIAVDQDAVTPSTTYEDTGSIRISGFTIKNFDEKAHGRKNMTEVLQESLNLGIIFATQHVANATFVDYVKRFGFGVRTGIELSQELAGSLGDLGKLQDVYKATASFGQGLTVTPLQMLTAINAIANNGVLVKPFIVDEVRKPDGSIVTTESKDIRRVVTEETAQTVAAMLVRVLDTGYDDKASVAGYYLAGKTGTAQIAEGGEYSDKTNHTFVGFGPVPDSKFSVIIKLHDVKNVGFAADSTTPLFHSIAEFLLQYYKIPPNR